MQELRDWVLKFRNSTLNILCWRVLKIYQNSTLIVCYGYDNIWLSSLHEVLMDLSSCFRVVCLQLLELSSGSFRDVNLKRNFTLDKWSFFLVFAYYKVVYINFYNFGVSCCICITDVKGTLYFRFKWTPIFLKSCKKNITCCEPCQGSWCQEWKIVWNGEQVRWDLLHDDGGKS